MNIPEYLILRLKSQNEGSLEIRKLRQAGEVGVRITQQIYEFPGSKECEFFLDKKGAEYLVESLINYFKLR